MWNIKREGLRAKLHRSDRDYHLSAAMYCETAALDQFSGFSSAGGELHWSPSLRRLPSCWNGMRNTAKPYEEEWQNGFDTGEWSAPITEDYTDEN